MVYYYVLSVGNGILLLLVRILRSLVGVSEWIKIDLGMKRCVGELE